MSSNIASLSGLVLLALSLAHPILRKLRLEQLLVPLGCSPTVMYAAVAAELKRDQRDTAQCHASPDDIPIRYAIVRRHHKQASPSLPVA
ncbi:hypothetical protein F5X96DRAFT_657974 [Biscogniauxia mediterranea]|nr:hypothetical protein F5X96DRAFT_657974 [Biscogniauxia mediterranea]